jgi:hypothetical protein
MVDNTHGLLLWGERETNLGRYCGVKPSSSSRNIACFTFTRYPSCIAEVKNTASIFQFGWSGTARYLLMYEYFKTDLSACHWPNNSQSRLPVQHNITSHKDIKSLICTLTENTFTRYMSQIWELGLFEHSYILVSQRWSRVVATRQRQYPVNNSHTNAVYRCSAKPGSRASRNPKNLFVSDHDKCPRTQHSRC